MIDLTTYADGTNDLVTISKIVGKPVWELHDIALRLAEEGLFCEVEKGNLTRASTLQ